MILSYSDSYFLLDPCPYRGCSSLCLPASLENHDLKLNDRYLDDDEEVANWHLGCHFNLIFNVPSFFFFFCLLKESHKLANFNSRPPRNIIIVMLKVIIVLGFSRVLTDRIVETIHEKVGGSLRRRSLLGIMMTLN